VNAIALIDGEHHGDVVRDALAELPFEFVGAILVGGTEKLRGGEDYGVPLLKSLDEARADVVVDLSDEPVLGPRERMLWASKALARGLEYVGADFRFRPPAYLPAPSAPSLAVVGTGKRIGKTAVTGHVARLLSQRGDVVVVSMGRGGPPEPQLVQVAPTLDQLLDISRAGGHAASDYLETAALAGVPTIGCRRAGGGLAGDVLTSNLRLGIELAEERRPDVIVFDGSGAAIPPVSVDARVLVVGPGQDATAYLNPYRVLVSDLVLLMGGGDTDTNAAIAGALLGAIHGLAAIPAQWRDAVLTCRPRRGALGVQQPRPEALWPGDALELAEQLLAAGRRAATSAP
jgi:cyclic 2,3-diphosphoglycerate synthetase